MNKRVRMISAMVVVILAVYTAPVGFSQTASTGALTGTTTDATRAVIPGVEITLTSEATGVARSATSAENGSYVFPQVVPGSYRVEAALPGFRRSVSPGIRITVTETARLDIQLEVGASAETVTVEAAPVMVQQETSALGRVVSQSIISSLPLVTRNFTQILGLSPGITTDVTNAGELGRGSGGQILGRTTVNGTRPQDSNFQLDGVDTNDFQASDSGLTPGTAVPNPDAIQEFKVQTAQADASFGRNSGAQVNVISRGGTNEFHGALFHFFRNEALNANDFFFNKAGQKKPPVRQNQYGGTIGGPIIRDSLLFFGSYQGTKQLNGLAAGKVRAKCSTTISSPPLTDDRSAAALGALFGGLAGQNGGVAIRPDGSNINPVALRGLNLKKADGTYVFPTPQVIDPKLPFARQGFSAFSDPCTFEENQYVTNVDYLQTDKSKISGRLFIARSNRNVTFSTSAANIPGSPTAIPDDFRVLSVAYSYVLSPRVFNEFRVGQFHFIQRLNGTPLVKWSDLGLDIPDPFGRGADITITGAYAHLTGEFSKRVQDTYSVQDHLSYSRGAHTLRFGGGASKIFASTKPQISASSVSFQSFPDFLLGLEAARNGSQFSNIFASTFQSPLLNNQNYWHRVVDGFAYVQDDYKIGPRLALNLGARYERLGSRVDHGHRVTNFVPALANPNPPAEGTLQGFVVGSDWTAALPPGVIKYHTPYGIDGLGQNQFAPRIGFAWQIMPSSNRLVLRGGYGIYYTHAIGVQYTGLGTATYAPSTQSGTNNAAASWQNPLPPPNPVILDANLWQQPAYSPTTQTTTRLVATDWRPGMVQQYSLNTQTEFAKNFLLEIGYVGSRGTHLNRGRGANQALLASPSNPIRGITTNTVANVRQRVPFLGFQPTTIEPVASDGASWYNSLQTSLTKRLSKGLQTLTSYTWSRTLDLNGDQFFGNSRGRVGSGDRYVK